MKQKIAIIVSIVLIVGLLWTGSAFAQEGDKDGLTMIVEPTEESEELNPVCEGFVEHPVLTRMAEHYDVLYEDLLTYFCEYEFGIGEIIHLFETLARTEVETSLEDILAMRMNEELGWGEIWQSLGLIGRGRKVDNSEDTEETESFARNENREKFKHQTTNGGEDDGLKNENKPEMPPGQEKEKNPNNPGRSLGKDKDKNHPGNGKKP